MIVFRESMRISIITVNYNNRDGLKKTIESVVSQSFKDYEWIVIDGGSTDGSRELIRQYADYIHYWVSEPDSGVYNAMNKGIAQASGDYMSFLNSGDVYADEHVLQRVSDHAFSQDLVFGDWCLEYSDRQVYVKEPEALSLHRLLYWSICHQAMFIKSSLLKQKGYDESYRIIADWKRWLEAVGGGCSVLHIPELVCIFDCSGMSFNNGQMLENEKRRLFEEDLVQFKRVRDFYDNSYKYPALSSIFDLYSASRGNRRILRLALKLIDMKNKFFGKKTIR